MLSNRSTATKEAQAAFAQGQNELRAIVLDMLTAKDAMFMRFVLEHGLLDQYHAFVKREVAALSPPVPETSNQAGQP
jgi:hypothetical protein